MITNREVLKYWRTYAHVSFIIDSLQFAVTCCMCPEQYDVRLDGILVGYVRIRHGKMTAQPAVNGEIEWDGRIETWELGDDIGMLDENERQERLQQCAIAIWKWL